jgi:hypothetical protein
VSFQSEPTSSGNTLLKALVVVTIALLAFWAANGGYDSIDVPGYVPPSTTTTTFVVDTSSTTIPFPTTTTLPSVTPTTIPFGTTLAG